MLTYETPLSRDETLVCLYTHVEAGGLGTSLLRYGQRYGFEVCLLPTPDCRTVADLPCTHLIVVAQWRQWAEVSSHLELWLAKFDSVSFSLEYDTGGEFARSGAVVESIKASRGDRINFLMPVRNSDGAWRVPHQKVLDNAVCDTVRVKYTPKRLSECPPRLLDEELLFFKDASAAFAKYRLFFRSPTDGYIALRIRSDAFVITATKTDKITLNADRLCIVHGYDSAHNLLQYSGRFLPSSDSVEASIIFQRHPGIKALIHTHASDLFTRNPRHRGNVLVPALPYGTPELGERVSEALMVASPGWIIMEDHGEVFCGSTAAEALYRLVQACKREIASDMQGETWAAC
jgi:ribulose-5-phosphate 4-epimerase/fuculose-1-phosphate aldolase